MTVAGGGAGGGGASGGGVAAGDGGATTGTGATATRRGPLALLRRDQWRHALLAAVFAQAVYADERGVIEPRPAARVEPARPPARAHGGGGEMSKCATNQRLMSTVSEK